MQQYYQQQNFQNQMQQQHMAMQMNMQNRGWAPKINRVPTVQAANRRGRSRGTRGRGRQTK